jgi:hypothetical protein
MYWWSSVFWQFSAGAIIAFAVFLLVFSANTAP